MDVQSINQSMPQNLFQVLTKVSLDTLNTGDILKGRIQSLDNGLLLINLSDGKTFTAAVPEGFSANQGDTITLEVGQRQNTQLTARIINIDAKFEGIADKQELLSASIEANLESIGVSNPREAISSVIELLTSKPQLDIEQASFLVANKLSQAPNMDQILVKISEHEFNLHDNLQTLQEGIQEALTKLNGESTTKALLPVLVSKGLEDSATGIKSVLSNVPPKIADSIVENVKGLLTKTLLDEISKSDGISSKGPVAIDLDDLEGLMKAAMLSTDKDGALPSEVNANKEVIPEGSSEVFSEGSTEVITKDLLKIINKALEDIHNKSSIISGKEGQEERIKQLKDVVEKLFDKAFIKIDKGIVEDVDVKEKAEALKDIMELAKTVLEGSDKSSREASLPVLKEINTAFRFFEQVTTYNSVLQLPIRMNQENTTGELYVMRRKNGRRKIDTENFTLFLSLSTQSLGLVESFLNATSKRITISFRLEDENLVKLFNDNYISLYEGLLEKNYVLVDMKCKLIDSDRANILNAKTKSEELLGTNIKLDLKI